MRSIDLRRERTQVSYHALAGCPPFFFMFMHYFMFLGGKQESMWEAFDKLFLQSINTIYLT